MGGLTLEKLLEIVHGLALLADAPEMLLLLSSSRMYIGGSIIVLVLGLLFALFAEVRDALLVVGVLWHFLIF